MAAGAPRLAAAFMTLRMATRARIGGARAGMVAEGLWGRWAL